MRLVSTYPSLRLAVSAFATAKGRQSRDCKHKVTFQKTLKPQYSEHHLFTCFLLSIHCFLPYYLIQFSMEIYSAAMEQHRFSVKTNTEDAVLRLIRLSVNLRNKHGFTRFFQNDTRQLKF